MQKDKPTGETKMISNRKKMIHECVRMWDLSPCNQGKFHDDDLARYIAYLKSCDFENLNRIYSSLITFTNWTNKMRELNKKRGLK